MKYSALSNDLGHVEISWRIADPSRTQFLLRWTEKDGPPLERPSRKGFGSFLIEQHLARTLHCDIRLAYEPDGVTCEIVAPLPEAAC